MRSVLNNRILLFIVAILLLANITMIFYFSRMKDQGKKSPHSEKQKSPITVFLEKDIGFDTPQMKHFDEVRQGHRKKMKPLFEDIRLAKVKFYGFLSKPGTSDSVLENAASLIGEKQKLLDLQSFRNFTEIRTICTPTQQPRYDSLIAGEIGKMWFPSSREKDHQKKENEKKDSLQR